MNQHRCLWHWLFIVAASIICLAPLHAGGPLYVTGLNATSPGQPYRWALNPIPYYTDLGGLGNQSQDQADALVASAFQIWQDVGTAAISLQHQGSLPYNVTASNVGDFASALGECKDPSQPAASIVYDLDGTIVTELGMDANSVLGFSGIICTDKIAGTNMTAGTYTRAWALMNGRFIDGQPETPSHNTSTPEEFKAVFVHEFGHLLGLDHSQINVNCYTETTCSEEDLAGVPVMFPVLLDGMTLALRMDDVGSISRLYPEASFAATTGRIRGRVLFSDGRTPAQGYNVIARLAGDSRRIAASCVSGYLFTAGAGNSLVPDGTDTNLFYGSRDPSLIGVYDIGGLPPGEYTIEVEALNTAGSIPFVGSSGVGPIGTDLEFQFSMPGSCTRQYLHIPSSPEDSCSASSTLSVAAGATVTANTDVILLGTPPRFDAWEDEGEE